MLFFLQPGRHLLPLVRGWVIRERRSPRIPRLRRRLAAGAFVGITIVACHVEQATGQRHGLRVIPGRVREDAPAPLLRGEIRYGVVSAAKLEGARALQVLALEMQGRPETVVEGAGRHHRSAMSHAFKTLGRGRDVVVGHHGALILPPPSVERKPTLVRRFGDRAVTGRESHGLKWEMGIRPGRPPLLSYRSGDLLS